MSIAAEVKEKLDGAGTFTLYYGYGYKAGEIVRFPTGSQETEKRNEKGRVILARVVYADNSRLEYRYSANTERYTLTVK